MKSIWSWVSLFLFSIFIGALSAQAAAPLEVQAYNTESAIIDNPVFNDAFMNALTSNSATTATAAAGDKGLEFCKTDKWAKTCLDLLITYRCTQYTFPMPGLGCVAAGSQFVGLLSMKKIDVKITDTDGKVQTYNLPVIFTRELEKLIVDPKVQAYLDGLMPAMMQAEKENISFNLFDYTMSKTGNNAFIATGLIAILFQDTSFVEIQAAYLEQLHAAKKIAASTWKSIQQIRYICDYLSPENMAEINKTGWFQMYPRIGTLNKDLHATLYHFYPMAFTASILSVSNGDRLGFFIPFLFNADYEFQTLDAERWPFNHPRPFEITPANEWSVSDIYNGFLGARFGAGLLKKDSDQVPFRTFAKDLAKNPFGFMQNQFWADFL